MSSTTRAASLAATALIAAVALTACSNDENTMEGMDHGSTQESSTPTESTDSTSADPAADFNDADVMFAQMMIPHHEQAIEMADILLANPSAGSEVVELAEQIKQAQAPEIETLNTWLTAWGADAEGQMDHGDMGHGDGMMTEEDLTQLAEAEGPSLDLLFLDQMLMHHKGAVDMAQDEVDNGQNPDAVALAQQIIETQEAEIATMEQQLANLTDANA